MLDTIVNRGAEPVRWLLVAAIAYSLATTIWTFFATPIGSPDQVNLSVQNNKPQRAPANLNWVLSKHLFGEAGAAPAVNQNTQEEAVQTRLPLELQSVFMADVKEDSAAIIAQKGKAGLLYKFGATIPGNAELIEVKADRVILRRAGVRETLGFPKRKLTMESIETDIDAPSSNTTTKRGSPQAPKPNNPNSPTDTQNEVSTAQAFNEYSSRLAEDAQGTLDELGIENGENGGYKLGANAQSGYLSKTGLQPGDVVMSVNGKPLGNIDQDKQEMQNILAQGSARIEVQRGSRRFFITVPLK